MKRSTIMWILIPLILWIKLGFYVYSFIHIHPEYGWREGTLGWAFYLGTTYGIFILYLFISWPNREEQWSVFFWIKKLNKYIDEE